MYSLAQKRYLAIQAGKDEVVLTMEEVENTLEEIRQLDETVGKYMEYVPEEVLKADADEMFGGRDEWSGDDV